MKKHYTDAELIADIHDVAAGNDPSEKERDAYFSDPANAADIEEQQARMDLVIELYRTMRNTISDAEAP